MLNLSFQNVFLAILQILFMGSCGYALAKKGIVDQAGLKLLSKMLINFFLPMFIFSQFTGSFSFEKFSNWWVFPLISIGTAAAAFCVSQAVLVFYKNLPDKREFNLLVMFQNSGYFQLLLFAALFQGEIVERLNIYVFLYMSAHAVLFWSFGIWWLLRKRSGEAGPRQVINPPLATLFISLILAYFGLNHFVPETLAAPIALFGHCTLPISILVVGGSLASVDMRRIDVRPVGGVVLSKLIIMPLLMLAVVCNIKIEPLLGAFLILQACAPSALILPIVARYYKIDEKFIDQSVFFTYVFSVLTIPVFLGWYIHLKGI